MEAYETPFLEDVYYIGSSDAELFVLRGWLVVTQKRHQTKVLNDD